MPDGGSRSSTWTFRTFETVGKSVARTHLSKYLAIPVLTHFVDLAEAGRVAVRALLRQIDDPAARLAQVVMPGDFERYGGR